MTNPGPRFSTNRLTARLQTSNTALPKQTVTAQSTLQPARSRVPALNYGGNYSIEVTVGTPAQSFLMHVDTGSSDLILCGYNATNGLPPGIDATHFYHPCDSTTFRLAQDLDFKIWYGDSSLLPIPPPAPSASGSVGTDILRIGGMSIQQQAIEYTNGYNSNIMVGPFDGIAPWDGIIGLGFISGNAVIPTRVENPMDNIITQNKGGGQDQTAGLGFHGFTCKFNSYNAGMVDDGSFLTFGYIDEDTVYDCGVSIQDIHYTRTDPRWGSWAFDSESAQVNGKVFTAPGNQALMDSGNSITYLQDEVCQAIYGAIPGSFQTKSLEWVYPAGTAAEKSLVITLAIGSQQFQFNPEGLRWHEFNSNKDWVIGGIQSRESVNSGQDIFGCTFMPSVYAIFDKRSNRIGAVQRPKRPADAPATFNATKAKPKIITSEPVSPGAGVGRGLGINAARYWVKPGLGLAHGPKRELCFPPGICKIRTPQRINLLQLPGYGESTSSTNGHDKLTIGSAILEALKLSLPHSGSGPQKIIISGHDRGGRICHRLAVDAKQFTSFEIISVIFMDIVPTLHQWSSFGNSKVVSGGGFHWPFLANVELATSMIMSQGGGWWCRKMIERWAGSNEKRLKLLKEGDGMDTYCQYFDRESVVRASCEDYRSGAYEDVNLQKEDQAKGRKIAIPTMVIFSDSYLGARNDVGKVWIDWVAEGVTLQAQGTGDGTGHFLPEEAPEEVANILGIWLEGLKQKT